MTWGHNAIEGDAVGSIKSLNYIHMIELPVNKLICNRWLMRAYDPGYQKIGMRRMDIHVTLAEIGKRDDQIGFALEQRARVPALYGYRQHIGVQI